MVQQAGVQLRLHSWFSQALVDGDRIKGVICETKNGSEAILADMVIDATGDLDVAASAGAPHISDSYITTTVFRLGGVDTEAAERYEREEPEAYAELDRQIKRVLGGSWGIWWMKTPLPGVVWQLPAHGRHRRAQGRRPDARGNRGPPAHPRTGRLRARQAARLRAVLRRRRGPADRRAPDPPAGRRVCDDQGRRGAARALRRQHRARP